MTVDFNFIFIVSVLMFLFLAAFFRCSVEFGIEDMGGKTLYYFFFFTSTLNVIILSFFDKLGGQMKPLLQDIVSN